MLCRNCGRSFCLDSNLYKFSWILCPFFIRLTHVPKLSVTVLCFTTFLTLSLFSSVWTVRVVHVDGWDYVSELWPPVGLLFIPQVIYECGNPQWNDIQTQENSWFVHQCCLVILPAELSSRETGETWRRNENFAYKVSLFVVVVFFNML
jgi:hypothetical protein